MKPQDQPIYHLVPQSYYLVQSPNQPYLPVLFVQEGFIHCTAGIEMLLQVANAFFADLPEPLLALEIDPDRLTAPLKFEPPASPKSVDSDFTPEPDRLFPHIYGPLNREAIKRTITLQRSRSGQWQMS
ncbi:MAG TPA: DUF952 domain-containing protein [Anaerolineae bacterium]|nr:DUF952 domain-containing protein [Anaerolineae bacterium]